MDLLVSSGPIDMITLRSYYPTSLDLLPLVKVTTERHALTTYFKLCEDRRFLTS